jgi:cation diffusion facilitator CzcD-associated flavoprotein CzcO
MASNHVFALIVGGGMSGITLAAQLLDQKILRGGEFVIVDRWNDYGGVWEANKYPGAACDVPSHAYVLPFYLNPTWSREYASQPEIQKYYAAVAQHYRLRECSIFDTTVLSATWNANTLTYTVVVQNNTTGELSTWFANVVVDAGGQFWRPKYANIPGAEKFKGAVWHTSQWRDDYDLRGKRVAMIGTGPSTAQVAPRIQPLVKELILYQRSATYCMPRHDKQQPGWKRALFKWFPPFLWAYHLWYYFSIEGRKRMWLSGTTEQAQASAYAIHHLETTVKDPITREKLRPTHQFGCKRILVLDDWYPMFNQPNVKLITDKPVRITEDGIVSKPAQLTGVESSKKDPVDGYNPELPVPLYPAATGGSNEVEDKIDVLIWGTGFDMTHQGSHFQVNGIDGANLEQLWDKTSPRAYYAVGVNKFPNFMMMLGPNSANFWSNLTLVCLIQARYNSRLIKKIRDECRKAPYALNVSEKAQEDYNKYIYGAMGNIAILSPGCHNYYTNDKGEATFWNPMHGWTYAWRTWWPKWSDYDHFGLGQKASKPIRKEAETSVQEVEAGL